MVTDICFVLLMTGYLSWKIYPVCMKPKSHLVTHLLLVIDLVVV